MAHLIEYRVRPVTRYIVSRYEDSNGATGASSQHGEFDNFEMAYAVGYALCKAEHDRLGWAPGDERIQYPRQLLRGGNVANSYAVAVAQEACQAMRAASTETL